MDFIFISLNQLFLKVKLKVVVKKKTLKFGKNVWNKYMKKVKIKLFLKEYRMRDNNQKLKLKFHNW